MNSKLAGTTMCKISFEGMLALKRAGLVLPFRTVYSARLQEKLITHTKIFSHGCTRKFTIHVFALIVHTMQSFKHHLSPSLLWIFFPKFKLCLTTLFVLTCRYK